MIKSIAKANVARIAAIALAVSAFLLVAMIPVQATQTDDKIKLSAENSYVFKTFLKNDSINIQSRDGMVTLTGSVTDESHKALAEETLANLPGVTNVTNHLVVTGTPFPPHSDDWLIDRVRGTMRVHRSVSLANTKVFVDDGRVTLLGEASSEAQKQLATEYARDVAGVKSVDNQMTVVDRPAKPYRTDAQKIDDASITTQVMLSLRYHHGMDVFDTKVSTLNGMVTLEGTANNQAEIDFATKRVNDIHGVTGVTNNMTVGAIQSSTE